MTALRGIRVALWAAVALSIVAVGGFLWLAPRLPGTVAATANAGAPLGGPFRLLDQNGREVTEALFRGRPSAVFFGYTHCPDVCPTTLAEMAGWLGALGPKGKSLNPVFVTVDPERDTPAVLKDYVGAVSDRITAVTGAPEDVAAMLQSYAVFARKVPGDGGEYTMDHTASVFLLDAQGRLVGTVSYGESGEVALAKLTRLVEGQPTG